MKIVTFNIRYDNNQDGDNSFCFRKVKIAEKIKSELPDIICFQEVLPHVAAWLKEELTSYYVLGCGRDADLSGEQVCVAFLTNRYQIIHMNTFWLSNTPTIPGSRYKVQSICPRTCTEVLLQDGETKKVFRILNTHLDHEGGEARVLGMEQILGYAKQVTLFPDAPIIITGDFNAIPNDAEIDLFQKNSLYTDVTKDISGTFHDFGRIESPLKIDYIVVTNEFHCTLARLWDDVSDGIYLSDHYPIEADLCWKQM